MMDYQEAKLFTDKLKKMRWEVAIKIIVNTPEYPIIHFKKAVDESPHLNHYFNLYYTNWEGFFTSIERSRGAKKRYIRADM
jgi:hypothetical protein